MVCRCFFIFLLLITLFLGACRKDNSTSTLSNKKDEGDNKEITAEYYAKGKLNGESFTWQCREDFLWIPGTKASSSLWQGNVTSDHTACITAKADKSELGITFKTYYVEFEQSKEDIFNNFINTGSWMFSDTEDFHIGLKRTTVVYTDKNEKQYSSLGQQTGSNVNVISVTKVYEPYIIRNSLKIKITLNCKLYPKEGTGDVLTLTDAETVLHLKNLL